MSAPQADFTSRDATKEMTFEFKDVSIGQPTVGMDDVSKYEIRVVG
jgi:hypothetical protein